MIKNLLSNYSHPWLDQMQLEISAQDGRSEKAKTLMCIQEFSALGSEYLQSCEYKYFYFYPWLDQMRLEISAQDGRSEEAKTKASFVFDVYPEIYWEPLAIASNNSILVEESTSIAITRYDLQVESRQEMLPKDIIYTVISFFIPKVLLTNDDQGKQTFNFVYMPTNFFAD